MKRRAYLKAGGGAVGLGALAGCLDFGGGGGSGPITVGALEPLSGNFAPWGQAHRAGLEFARQEINEEGIDGREMEFVFEDTESDPTSANNIFQRHVEQENVVATTGAVSSDVGIALADTAGSLEIPHLLHMAGSQDVLSRDTRYTFRVGLVPAPSTMEAQAQLVSDAGYERVGAIIADYAWGNAVAGGIDSNFPVDVTLETASLDTGDFRPFIRQMPEDLEMMVATGHPPGSISIAGQQTELGYSPDVTTGPGIPPGVVWGALGEAAAQNWSHYHLTDVYSDAFRDVASRYAEANGERIDTHAGYGYVTAKLIAQAAREADSIDGPGLADALRSIEFDTIFANPIQYTEWGELQNQVQIYSQFEAGAPDYYSDGEWRLTEGFRTDPIEAYDPGQ